MSQVVESNNIGVLIDYSKESFIDGINKLVEMKADWDSISERMKKLYKDSYCWDEMERRLIQTYAELQEE